ncbi:hypothetical protein AUJ65_00855 [Candidatus Micrarchaeota archaeon CG1_02_51_15]|nr:MAG: hypothetical protein AUJ65_00855 [Candidatus Micrarchaeota archaeon CG1_02_51_15]
MTKLLKKANDKAKAKEHALARKFHDFAEIWREHAAEEVKIHKQMLGGHRNLKQHVRNTVKIHKKMLSKLKKFV